MGPNHNVFHESGAVVFLVSLGYQKGVCCSGLILNRAGSFAEAKSSHAAISKCHIPPPSSDLQHSTRWGRSALLCVVETVTVDQTTPRTPASAIVDQARFCHWPGSQPSSVGIDLSNVMLVF